MSFNYYKYCMVPQCKSTSIKTPNKLFIYVPNKEHIRKRWLKLARRADVHTLSTQSRMYFCEDHFDLPNDMVNYTQYHIMGRVSQIRMKPGCAPSKFECQEEMKKILKKRTLMAIVSKCLNEPEENSIQSSSFKYISNLSSDIQTVEENVPKILSKDKVKKSVKAFVAQKVKHTAVQNKLKSINQALSPLKTSLDCSSKSPFKNCTFIKSGPLYGISNITRNIMIKEEPSDSDISINIPYVATNSHALSPPLVHSSQVNSSSECSESIAYDRRLKAKETILNTMKKIEKKPQLYIGVPSSCYYLIDTIKDELNIPKHHLMFCLNKIRLDSKFDQLSDDYSMTPSSLSKMFFKNVPAIASAMRPFIVALDNEINKRNLPRLLRHKYHNVSCILDCLEIEVKKPSKKVNQALTWSKDKKAYTIKYLISCTPNGLINYISPGFGGRTTDTCLVESCDFVKTLKSGMCIMANREFKHVEQYLRKSGITLVRSQSAKTEAKMSNREAKLTKQKSSLRIHIEIVIQRLHEFYMLKPHACINYRFVKILDDIIVIACALVNLPDPLIK